MRLKSCDDLAMALAEQQPPPRNVLQVESGIARSSHDGRPVFGE
jgi:hypothetical protein